MNEAEAIIELIQDYLQDKVDQSKFNFLYPTLLKQYEKKIQGSASYPMDILVPSEDNSDQAWKENMKQLYLAEISKLDELLEENEPSYSKTMSVEKQKAHCREVLERMPLELLSRKTTSWAEQVLLEGDFFNFFDTSGGSKFGSYKTIYKATLQWESFILTALNGNLPALGYEYQQLLRSIEKFNGYSRATWLKCSEPDGIPLVDVYTFIAEPYECLDVLHWIEHTNSESTQGGVCHLILVAEDRSWMLSHTNTFKEFRIELHGSVEFIASTTGMV